MDILHISGDTYILPGATSIGIYLIDSNAYIIDTGIDENQIRKLYNYLNEKGISIKGVINTHCHADHTGGNRFLEKKGVRDFYSSNIEGFFIRYPSMITAFMFGSLPPKFMRIKMLMPEAIESTVRYDIPEFLRRIDLPGHSWGMFGIMTPDNVFFSADSIYSEDIVEKHPLLFHVNTEEFLETMKKLESINADFFVLSHGGLRKGISATVEKNIKSVENALSRILDLLPGTQDKIYSEILNEIGIAKEWEYYLNRVPFNSLITYLLSKDRIRVSLRENFIRLEKI
jgi:glyoxylase-like metal-dependent hydrolase (beta-lactamase superfamily II)